MSAHTRGPWVHQAGTPFIDNAKGLAICRMAKATNSDEHAEIQANARLIAAAPDLLEALDHAHALLTNLNPSIPGMPQALAMYRAALTKAGSL